MMKLPVRPTNIVTVTTHGLCFQGLVQEVFYRRLWQELQPSYGKRRDVVG